MTQVDTSKTTDTPRKTEIRLTKTRSSGVSSSHASHGLGDAGQVPGGCLKKKNNISRQGLLAMAVLSVMGLAACSQERGSVNYEADSSVEQPVVVVAAPAEAEAASENVMEVVEDEVEQDSRDNYESLAANPVHVTAQNPVATLSIDTDTGSYANVRRYLNEGELPPAGAVRVEELINYFSYDFARAKRLNNAPFVVETELVDSPWDASGQQNQLLKVGIKAVDLDATPTTTDVMPPANLVFLVDVSGSMSERDKLPLAQASLKMLTKQLREQDSISIVTYAGHTEVVLPTTSGDNKAAILEAIDDLSANGSTNGADALEMAYAQANTGMKEGGVNRILMLTDGDFNVGRSSVDDIVDIVKTNRDRGISLTTIGFGRGNLNDHMMEQVADNGNGNYSYIDSLSEAKKVLNDELASTFVTVAKDVKVQLEFNPQTVKEWRLIGYENRVLREQDFDNDQVDAGDLGAGKSVVALFEITPVGKKGVMDERRYNDGQTAKSQPSAQANSDYANELGFLKLRYKQPTATKSTEVSVPIAATASSQPSADTQFVIAVAGFGQVLKGNEYVNDWQYADSTRLAEQSIAKSGDKNGWRSGFVTLTELADSF